MHEYQTQWMEDGGWLWGGRREVMRSRTDQVAEYLGALLKSVCRLLERIYRQGGGATLTRLPTGAEIRTAGLVKRRDTISFLYTLCLDANVE